MTVTAMLRSAREWVVAVVPEGFMIHLISSVRYLIAAVGGGGIFDEFFGRGRGGGGRAQVDNSGSDLRYDLEISLEEAAFGCEKELEIEKLVTCSACDASGSSDDSGGNSTCGTCGGAGAVISSRGFFPSPATLSTLWRNWASD